MCKRSVFLLYSVLSFLTQFKVLEYATWSTLRTIPVVYQSLATPNVVFRSLALTALGSLLDFTQTYWIITCISTFDFKVIWLHIKIWELWPTLEFVVKYEGIGRLIAIPLKCINTKFGEPVVFFRKKENGLLITKIQTKFKSKQYEIASYQLGN